MKVDATLEDFKNREKFLIKYIESQIEKKSHGFADGAKEAYQDILYKLNYGNETRNTR